MSSILKALKKLENERPFSKEDRPWLKEIQGKEPISDRLIGNWIAHRRFFTVGAVILLGLAGAAFIVFKVDIYEKIGTSGKFEKQRDTISVPGVLSDNKPQAKTTMSRVSVPLANVQSPVQSQTLAKGQRVLPNNSALKKRIPEITTFPVQQSVAEPSLIETSTSMSDVSSDPDSQTVAATDDDKAIGNYAGGQAAVKILNNEMIKLQAVSWSQDPEKRIAVINNRIVRQGAGIEGYFVIEINKDDVILEQGEEMWKVQFRPR